jgi:hypothetical protein
VSLRGVIGHRAGIRSVQLLPLMNS